MYVQENEFNSSEVLVLIGIANYTNKQGRGARASHATLGKIVKLKDRALKLVIDRLIRRGILERISTTKGYEYNLLVPLAGPLHKKADVNCNLQQIHPPQIATCNSHEPPYIATMDPINPDPIDPAILKSKLRFFGATEGGEFWKLCLNGHAESGKADNHGSVQ